MRESKISIFDCDPGIDDAVSLVLAHSSLPKDHRFGIFSSYGCSNVTNTSRNAAIVSAGLLGREIAIVEGADRPGDSSHPLIKSDQKLPTFFGSDGFNDVFGSHEAAYPQVDPADAVKNLHEYLYRTEAGANYFLTGPCTNLARLIEIDPELVREKIGRLFIMGGAVDTPGNCGRVDPGTQLGVAEFNFYLDAKAAEAVLHFDLDTVLVTWDQAKKCLLPRSVIDRLDSKSIAGSIVISGMQEFFSLYSDDNHDQEGRSVLREPSLIFSDPLTVLAQQGVGKVEDRKIRVVTTGEDYGRTIEDSCGARVKYFQLDDPEKGLELMLRGVLAD